jgi:large repetitive protein
LVRPLRVVFAHLLIAGGLAGLFVVPLSPGIAVAAGIGTQCGDAGTPTVVALANPNFYVDFGVSPRLDANYSGYTVRAGATALAGLRVVLSGFTGGAIALAPNQPASTTLDTLAPGSATTAYFLFQASSLTTTPQTHTISLFQGATKLCDRTFTFARVADTIKALANKVNSVSQSVAGDGATLGDTVEVTVQGNTGTLGSGPSFDPGVLSYAPTAIGTTFPAGAWRLERTELTISPDGVAAPITIVDRLYLAGASGPSRNYTAKYRFRAIGPSSVPARVQPVQYIASGTQVKHTDLGGTVSGDDTLPAVGGEAAITLSKTVDTSLITEPAGPTTVRFTVTATNTGSSTGVLDRFDDTLPAGTTYVAATARYAGRTVTPAVSGNTLTFYGPFNVPAGGTATLVYDVTVPATAGSYVNAITAWFADAKIDGSANLVSDDPATAVVVVRAAGSALSAVDDSVVTSAGQPVTVDVFANDTPNPCTGCTVALVNQPGNGTATVVGSQIVYTPDAGFGGADQFEYRISDGISSDTAMVTVSVPLARGDTYAFAQDNKSTTTTVPASSGVLANDFCSSTGCTGVTLATSGAPAGFTLNADGSFSYTYPSGGSTQQFTYTLTTASGATASAMIRLIVSSYAPDRVTTSSSTAVTINVLANDTCSTGGSSCNPSSITSPANGQATLNAATVTYQPFGYFWGVDSFTYSKNATGDIDVLVAPPNGTFTTTFGQSITRTIASSAYLTELTGLSPTTVAASGFTYTIGQLPSKGSVSLNTSSSQWVYTPDQGSAGLDTFTVVITEPGGLSVTTTITIRIGPIARDDIYEVDANGSLTVTAGTGVLANDNCPTTCTLTLLTSPAAGTFTLNADGGFTYTPSGTSIGEFTATYAVETSVAPGTSSSATVRITVQGASDDAATTTPGTPVDIDVKANDPCANCDIAGVGTVTRGTAVTVSGQTNIIRYTPPSGYVGTVTVPYTVRSNNGTTSSAQVHITVLPLAVADTVRAVANTTAVFDVLANDVCIDCRVTAVSAVGGAGGSVAIVDDGFAVAFTAPASGTSTFTYTLTDAGGYTSSTTVTVDVAAAPVARADVASTSAGTAVAIDVLANDERTPGIACGTACGAESRRDPSNGVASLRANGGLQYVPKPGFTGVDVFEYLTTNEVGLTATASVRVRVNPIAANDAYTTGKNSTRLLNVKANDVCSSCTLAVVSVVKRSGGISPQGGFSLMSAPTVVESNGDISFTSTAEEGVYDVTYTITDTDTSEPAGEPATAVATVTVSDATADAIATAHNTAVTLDVIANDVCSSSSCTIASVTSPTSGTAAIASSTAVTFTPATGFGGLAQFSYTTSVGSSATVSVLVAPAMITQTTPANTALAGTVMPALCNDCDIDLLVGPLEGEITLQQDGTYSYAPRENLSGYSDDTTYRITHTVSGVTVSGVLRVTVQEVTTAVSLSVASSVDQGGNGRDDAGDTVNVTYTVTNTGGTTLTLAQGDLVDPRVGAVTCAATLAPGVDHVCNGTTTLTQGDLDAGGFTFTATVSATSGSTTATASATNTVSVTREPALTLVKSATPSSSSLGSTIPYSFAVTNTGNVTLDSLAISDPLPGLSTVTCPVTTLIPAASTTCTADLTLTQAHVDAGGIVNTATASAAVPSGSPALTPAAHTVNITIDRTAEMTLVKTGTPVSTVVAPNDRLDAGDRVDFSLLVTNTGTTTLTNVAVADALPGLGPVSCPATQLAVAASMTCTAELTLTQAHLDAGAVTNSASVTATTPDGALNPTTTSAVTVNLTQAGALTLDVTVTSSTSTGGANGLGEITYLATVTNSGNVTLTNVALVDDRSAFTCSATTVAVGAATTCTGTTDITAADTTTTTVTLNTTASATTPLGVSLTDTDTRTTVVSGPPSVTLAVATSVDQGGDSRDDAGDTVTVTYTITNTGGVDLTVNQGDLIDARFGSVTCTATLTPGTDTTCTATTPLTQADVDAGGFTLTATVSATSASSTVTDSASATVTLTQAPALTMAVTTDGATTVGSTLTYLYTVTNSGNATLDSLAVVDPLTGLSALSCATSTVTVGAAVVCTATLTITQAHVDAGSISSTATASATTPLAAAVTTTGTHTAVLARLATLAITHTASVDMTAVAPIDRVDAGDQITYLFTVTNSGTTTLTNVTVAATVPALEPTCGATTLAVGDTMTCTAVLTITQTHLDNGSLANTATATGTTLDAALGANATHTVTATLTQAGALQLHLTTTSATTTGGTYGLGQVGYLATVTNSGNVTLTSMVVATPANTTFTCAATTLAVAASTTCTATRDLHPDDVAAADITLTATASATTPLAASVTSTSMLSLTNARPGALTLTATATPSSLVGTGTTTYTITVTNSGVVPVTGATVTLPGVTLTCTPATPTTLAVGATLTCTGSVNLTAGEVSAGGVTRSATATGAGTDGNTVSVSQQVVVTASEPAPTPTPSPAPAPTPSTTVPPTTPFGAVDDLVSAPMGAIVEIDLLANDQGSDLQLRSITTPTNADLRIVGNTVRVTPELTFVGRIQFSYTMSDGTRTDGATVTVDMRERVRVVLPEMFLDLDRSSSREPNEPGIPGVVMNLELINRATFTFPDMALAAVEPRPEAQSSGFHLASTLATFSCTTDRSGICTPPPTPAGSYRFSIGFDLEASGMELTAAPSWVTGFNTSLDLSSDILIQVQFGLADSLGVSGTGTLSGPALGDGVTTVVWAGVDGIMGTDDDVVITVPANGPTFEIGGLPTGNFAVVAGTVDPATWPTTARQVSTVTVTGTHSLRVVPSVLSPDPETRRLPSVGSDAQRLDLALAMVVLGAVLLVARRRLTRLAARAE